MTDHPRPFLKWAGGKTQLLPQLIEHLPEEWNAYHEPFVGGGALFFGLVRAGLLGDFPAFISDLNRELVDAYRAIRVAPGRLCDLLADIQKRHGALGREEYINARLASPWKLGLNDRAARMIFLNKAGFNGLYRVNADGRFNVPWGNQPKKKIFDRENIMAVSESLRAAEVLCESFGDGLYRAQPGDLVYFDPPYVPASETSNFTAFTRGGFDLRDQEQLAGTFEALVKRGAFVMLSNSDTPWVRERYAEHRIVSLKARRAINSDGAKRGEVGEVLVCGW